MTSDSEPDGLAELIEEFIASFRDGKKPSPEAFVARMPEHAELIRQRLAVLQAMEAVGADDTDLTGDYGAAPDPATLPEQIGNYRIIRELGRGGMGVVYEAEQVELKRRVALKVLPNPTTGLDRFLREAQAAASLNHPNIVPVFEVRVEGEVWFYAMQLVSGTSLDRVISDLHKLRTEPSASSSDSAGSLGTPASDRTGFYRSFARIGVQAARALHFAHRQGFIHRDIKPGNVLLDAAAHVWIADFGLVRTTTSDLTDTGVMLGTPRYFAPELLDGYVGDPQSDEYALGLTLYELLLTRPAFQWAHGEAFEKLFKQIRLGPGKPRETDPAVPRDLERILLKAIDVDRTQRYITLDDLADDFQRFLDGHPVNARPLGKVAVLWRWARRNPWVAGLGSLAAIMLLAIGIGGPLFAWQLNVQHNIAEKERAERLNTAYEKAILAASNRRDFRAFITAVDAAETGGVEILPAMRLELIRAANGISDVARVRSELERVDLDTLPPDLRGQFELWHATVLFGVDDTHSEQYLAAACTRPLPPADRAYASALIADTTLDAIEHSREAIARDLFHQPARHLACVTLMTLGRNGEAISLSRESAALFPDDLVFTIILSQCASRLGDDKTLNETLARMPEAVADSVRTMAEGHSAGERAFRARSGYDPRSVGEVPRFEAGLPHLVGLKYLGLAAHQPESASDVTAKLPRRQRERLAPYLVYLQEFGNFFRSPRPEQIIEQSNAIAKHPDGFLLLALSVAHYDIAMRQGLRPDSTEHQLDELREAARLAERAAKEPGIALCQDIAIDMAIAIHSLLGYERRLGKRADPTAVKRAVQLLKSRIKQWGDPPMQHLIWMVRVSMQAGEPVLARGLLDQWQKLDPDNLEAIRARARLEDASQAFPLALSAAERVLEENPCDKEMRSIRDRCRERLAK